jgi:hypothetical protein
MVKYKEKTTEERTSAKSPAYGEAGHLIQQLERPSTTTSVGLIREVIYACYAQ